MTTFRGAEDIDALRRRVATVAERIEAGMFEPRENPLCNWCDFKPKCPLFRHAYEREEAPRIAEVVDEWVTLKRDERDRGGRLEELGALIRAYAEEHALEQLFGTDGAVRIVERVETTLDAVRVRELLEPLGLWDSVLAVDPGRLGELVESRTLPPAVEEALLAGREEVHRTKALHLRDGARASR